MVRPSCTGRPTREGTEATPEHTRGRLVGYRIAVGIGPVSASRYRAGALPRPSSIRVRCCPSIARRYRCYRALPAGQMRGNSSQPIDRKRLFPHCYQRYRCYRRKQQVGNRTGSNGELRSNFQSIQVVRPSLHHAAAFREVLGQVVNTTHAFAAVRQLTLDCVGAPSLLVE